MLNIKKNTAVFLSAFAVSIILTVLMFHKAVSQDSANKPAVYERGKPDVLLINSYHRGLSGLTISLLLLKVSWLRIGNVNCILNISMRKDCRGRCLKKSFTIYCGCVIIK